MKKGDLLFVIDPRPFLASLEQAQGQLKSDQAQLELNRRNLQRDEHMGQGRLVDPGNYVSTGGAPLVNIQRQDPV